MDNSDKEHMHQLEEYKSQIKSLENEIEELKTSLHSVNDKLQESEKFKGHFISNVTNEIINPFTSIMALAESIKSCSTEDVGKAHKMADLIYAEAFHLDFQLKNIFAAAQIEAGKEELKVASVNLFKLAEEVIAYFDQEISKKNIKLVIQTDFGGDNDEKGVLSDREKIDMILKNLVSNSIKYSPEDSSVELILKHEDQFIEIEVSDKGKGISSKDRATIFDRFKQLDEKIDSINTGHGLGLSIVLAYADLLNGEVYITDNVGQGTRVIVRIPESSNEHGWDDLEGFILDSDLTI